MVLTRSECILIVRVNRKVFPTLHPTYSTTKYLTDFFNPHLFV